MLMDIYIWISINIMWYPNSVFRVLVVFSVLVQPLTWSAKNYVSSAEI